MPAGIPTFPVSGRIANGTGDGALGASDRPEKDLGNAESNRAVPGKKKPKRKRRYNIKRIKGL